MDVELQLWAHNWRANGGSTRVFNQYRRHVVDLLVVTDGDMHSVRRQDVLAFLASSATPHVAHWRWLALRSFYKTVTGTEGPLVGVACPKRPESPQRGVSETERDALLATCTTRMLGTRDRAIILTLWHTGMRRSELTSLHVDDLLDTQQVMLRHTKTDRPRVVPLADEAHVAILRWLIERRRHRMSTLPNLWLAPKGGLSNDGVQQMFASRSARAGVKVTPHMFRRSFAVRWLSAGGSQAGLKAIAGWSSDGMVSRYVRHSAESLALAEHKRLFG